MLLERHLHMADGIYLLSEIWAGWHFVITTPKMLVAIAQDHIVQSKEKYNCSRSFLAIQIKIHLLFCQNYCGFCVIFWKYFCKGSLSCLFVILIKVLLPSCWRQRLGSLIPKTDRLLLCKSICTVNKRKASHHCELECVFSTRKVHWMRNRTVCTCIFSLLQGEDC